MRHPVARRPLFDEADDRGHLKTGRRPYIEKMLTLLKDTPRNHGPDRLIRPWGQLCQFSDGKVRFEDGRIHGWRAARRLGTLSSAFD